MHVYKTCFFPLWNCVAVSLNPGTLSLFELNTQWQDKTSQLHSAAQQVPLCC